MKHFYILIERKDTTKPCGIHYFSEEQCTKAREAGAFDTAHVFNDTPYGRLQFRSVARHFEIDFGMWPGTLEKIDKMLERHAEIDQTML